MKTDWNDMKRVLIDVGIDDDGARYGVQMIAAATAVLNPDLYAHFSSYRDIGQKILYHRGAASPCSIVGIAPPCPWLGGQAGHCPPQFVLCAPRAWFRDGVPDYTGPVKGETK